MSAINTSGPGRRADAGKLAGPRCILPGCRNVVEVQGLPCAECVEIFGDTLRQTDGPRMTAEAQAKRDRETHATYAVLLSGGDPARAPEAGGRAAATPEGLKPEQPERKPNQRCWMCEERRTCTRQPQGWECDKCMEIS